MKKSLMLMLKFADSSQSNLLVPMTNEEILDVNVKIYVFTNNQTVYQLQMKNSGRILFSSSIQKRPRRRL